MSTKGKITELFRSVQGEGKYAGVQQVFLRFEGCNLDCAWCDTREAARASPPEVRLYTPEDLWQEVEALHMGCHSVSLTGGEPLGQVEFLKEFLPFLKINRVLVYLETNGTLAKAMADIVDDVDIVSMDVKLPSSAKIEPCWDEHVDFLRATWGKDVFIKTVISKSTTMEDIIRAVDMISQGDPGILFFLQPNYFEIDHELIEKCLEYQNYCLNYLTDVRVMPQVHKFINLR